MKTFLKYTLYLLLLAFVACSSEDDATPTGSNGQAQPGDALELTVSATDFVTDGAPDTRATDSSTTTTFEDDDRVGVIVLDGTGELLYNNIPYEYNSNSNQWMFDSDNDEGKDGCYYDPEARTYIVYYPYSPAADGVRNIDKLKSIFPPKTNQSTKQDYRASDLMVWSSSSITPPVMELNAKLTHAYASVFLTPTVGEYVLEDKTSYNGCYKPKLSDISDVNLTIENAVYVPYQTADGSIRCIFPAGITSCAIRSFYTLGGKTYGNTINISDEVVANTCYACAPKIENVIYSLENARVGDFYCKNSDNEGYLIPGDVLNLSDNQKTACIGIVYCVDNSFITSNSTNKAANGFTHGLVVALKDASSSSTWYEAPDFISQYGQAESVPNNCSSWYFPNLDEMKYICWGSSSVQSSNGKDILNTQFNKLGENATIFVDTKYWSGTRGQSSGAYYLQFASCSTGWELQGSGYRIRSSLAF